MHRESYFPTSLLMVYVVIQLGFTVVTLVHLELCCRHYTLKWPNHFNLKITCHITPQFTYFD